MPAFRNGAVSNLRAKFKDRLRLADPHDASHAGEYWKLAYLISSDVAAAKPNYYIGTTGDLLECLAQHNRHRSQTKRTRRRTMKGAPHWRYRMFIGPFLTGTTAVRDAWEKCSSDVESALEIGMQIARGVQDECGEPVTPVLWIANEGRIASPSPRPSSPSSSSDSESESSNSD